MAKENHTGRNVALGALVAGVAGYLAGILTAPKSGKETRQDIKEGAINAKDELIEKYNELKVEVDELIEQAKAKTGELRGRAKEQLDEAVATAKVAKSKASEVAKAVKAGEAENPELDKAIRQLKNARNNLTKYLKS